LASVHPVPRRIYPVWPFRPAQGCQKGRFWKKITVRTSFSSGHPWTSARIRVYPADTVLPADGFLPSAHAVKKESARTQPSVRTDMGIRADASPSPPLSLPPLPSPPLPPLPPSPLLSARGYVPAHAKKEKKFNFRFSIPKIPKLPKLPKLLQLRGLCGRSHEKKKVFSA
jgi:hypothetical protein